MGQTQVPGSRWDAPGVLRELAEVFPRPFSITCVITAMVTGRRSWGLAESKCRCCLREGKQEDAANYRLANLTLIPGKVMEQIILETISRHMEDNAAISQNHRIAGFGRDLCGSSSPSPLPKQGHLQQAAQDLVQAGLE